MKTPEDEAFDELARKQGAWGGGFKAKRQMAMDKLQEPAQEPLAWMCHPFGDDEVEYGTHQECENCVPLYTTPPQRTEQEPDALTIAYQSGFYDGKKAAQRQWVGLTDDEIEEIFQSAAGADEETHIRFAKAIEAKLKERNS